MNDQSEKSIENKNEYASVYIHKPDHICPKHGNIGSACILSTMEDFLGKWCLRCWLEMLDNAGVHRVTEKEDQELKQSGDQT